MIFRCSDQGCGYFGEGPRLPEFCPRCGKRMLQAAEGEMTGDDWSALGVFWISRPDGKERGLACFRRSAGMGSGWGTCNLGICMEQGLGVEADPRQAFWLYQQAVEMGSLSAVCNLGVCYEQGIGTTSDQKKAVELFRRAAEHGSSRGRGCWPAVWNRGWDCPRTKRLPWNGCGPPPFRGTPPARRSWPGTMSLASGRRSPPSRPYSGTAVRLRQVMRTDSAVWAG